MAFTLLHYVLGFACATIVFLGYFVYQAILPKPIPGIPYHYESANRILGNAPEVFAWKAKNGSMYDYLAHLAVELGSPIFQVFLRPLGRPWVVVMEPRESYDITTKRYKEFDRSKFAGDTFKGILPKMHVHMPTGDEWHAHRKLLNDTMSPWFLDKVAGPRMWSTTQNLIEMWRAKARLAQGRPFDASTDMSNGILDIIWAAAFDEEIGPNRVQAIHLSSVKELDLPLDSDTAVVFVQVKAPDQFAPVSTLTRSVDIPLGSLFPRVHYWLALHTYPSLVTARRQKDKIIRAKLDEAKEKFSSKTAEDIELMPSPRSVLELLVMREIKIAEKEGRQARLKTQGMQDELFGFLVAGHESTSTTACWMLKLLTTHQEVQSKLRNSLQTHFKLAAEEKRALSIEEITSSHIPYLEAVMEESARCGLATIAVIRQALFDTSILGHHIPKGIDVLMMNNGPGYVMAPIPVDESRRSKTSQAARGETTAWKPSDIQEFKPDRWIVEDEKGCVTFNPNAGPSMPFGAGPRACFGKKWALLELRILLVLIVWNFELLPTPPQLSDYRAIDGITHRPEKTYLRLRALT